jgi:hypothetical protein
MNDVMGRQILVEGHADCVGGEDLDPPLAGFPLLQWSPTDPVHPGKVVTSVGLARVDDIARDAGLIPDSKALAAKHKTTPEHIRQAIEYAYQASLRGR